MGFQLFGNIRSSDSIFPRMKFLACSLHRVDEFFRSYATDGTSQEENVDNGGASYKLAFSVSEKGS